MMFRLKWKLLALVIGSLSVLGLSAVGVSPSLAASWTKPEPSPRDILGIDIGSGQYFRQDTFIYIGGGSGEGLGWYYSPQLLTDTYSGVIEYWRYPAATEEELSHVRVNIAGNTTTFLGNCVTDGCVNVSGNGTTLVKSGSFWNYTSEDGTVYAFDAKASYTLATSTAPIAYIGNLRSVLRPNGVRLTINGSYNAGCTNLCVFKISSVASNTGFALKYDRNASGNLLGIYSVNLNAHVCDTAVTSCDGYDNHITFQTNSIVSGLSGTGKGVQQIVDALGNTTSYGAATTSRLFDPLNRAGYVFVYGIVYFRSPTGQELETTLDAAGRMTTFQDNRGTWRYDFNGETLTQAKTAYGLHTVSLYDPSNALVYSVRTNRWDSHLFYVDDALARRTSYTMTWVNPTTTSEMGYYRTTSIASPEGNSASYAYDTRGNVTTVTNVPKVGSGVSATSVTASYPTNCTYPKTCNQPTWTKDAKLNQTDYTYDNNNGGVLTVTLPVDTVGIRTRTYNTYTPFDTGNGIVYRLTRTETCGLVAAQLSLTACPAVVTTSVKVVDYGTSTTAPKTYKTSLPLTVTQTDGASTLSATTTYAYDNVGNIISVDGPLAGTVDQTFTTYDANRRKIFEIGPIPGGTGSYRSVVRHWYDADGKEWKTERGYSNTNATDGSGFVVVNFTRVTYDAAGRPGRTEEVQP